MKTCAPQNISAYQVFDKTSAHKERLKPKSKRKLSLSLKTWKFKFKNKYLQHNWSQMDLHQVIDRSKINNLYLCFGANFGLVRNKRTFQCLRLQKKAHKSRVLYQLRMLHDPGGKEDEHSYDIFETEVDIDKVQRTQMDTVAESVTTAPDYVASSFNDVAPSSDVIPKRQTMQIEEWDEACDAEIGALEGTGTWMVTSLPANKIPIGCTNADAVEIAQVTLLLQPILDDVKSHMRHKWKSKHLRAVYLQTTPSYALDVVNKPVTECKNDRVIATDLDRQAVLDQITKGLEMKKKMKVLKSWMFKYKPATSSSMLPLYVYQLGVSDKEMVADPVTQCLLGTLLWCTSFKKQKFCKDWWFKFKYNIRIGEALRLWNHLILDSQLQ